MAAGGQVGARSDSELIFPAGPDGGYILRLPVKHDRGSPPSLRAFVLAPFLVLSPSFHLAREIPNCASYFSRKRYLSLLRFQIIFQ